MRKLIFIAFAVWSFWSNHGHAATIRWVRTGSATAAITLTGTLRHRDWAQVSDVALDALRHNMDVTEIRLDSPGGYVTEGSNIADLVRSMEITTVVENNAECASACFMIFAAGKDKRAAQTARIGVHTASSDGEVTPAADNATMDMVRYVTKLGVPSSITGRMVTTQPYDMAWLNADELRTMGVRVEIPAAPERPLAFRPLDNATPAADGRPMAIVAKPAPAKPKAVED